jgi:ATP-dependent exoDNAse (exonuclease V) alpha subunit
MRLFQGLSITAAAAVLLIGAARADELTSLPGQRDQADSGPVVGVGVICNTSEQAEQFVSLRQQGQDLTPAVAKVNEQAQDPRACGMAAVAFVPDKTMATKPMGGKLVTIMRINVVAGYNGSGWQSVASTVQYAIMPTAGEEI